MKKSIFLLSLFAISLQLLATSWTPPSYVDTPPAMPSATLRVVGANARNYLYDFTASNADCTDQSCFDAKTTKMARVFDYLQADIVALCEIQQDNEILGYLVNAMNTEHGSDVYDYVTDNAKYNNPSEGNYGYIKCGYIYRKDKISKGTWYSTNSGDASFRNRMIVMCFTEKATNSKFVLSMNHFQAKTSDPEGTKRNTQAERLVNSLKTNYGDPDILLMGDLNAELTETCIQKLVTAGYEDQMYKYDNSAYTYNYKGSYQMIDHAMANSSMAKQIVGAYPFHICTSNGYKYSDHDCYVVGLKLEGSSAIDEIEAAPESKATLIYIDGKLFIRNGDQLFDMMGRRVE